MSYFNEPSSNSEMRLQAVRGYYELEMYDDAWDELKEIEKSYPLTPLILQMKILLLLKEKSWDLALGLSEKLQQMEPENVKKGFTHDCKEKKISLILIFRVLIWFCSLSTSFF